MPTKVDASTLKRLGIAPNNESVVLGVLRFLGLIDEDGARIETGKELFLKHDDEQFAKTLEEHVRSAYRELFDLRGDEAWRLDRSTLIGFFRAADETSSLTANRQAIAFETLAALSGHRQVTAPKTRRSEVKETTAKNSLSTSRSNTRSAGQITNPDTALHAGSKPSGPSNGLALTVRIEVNLPAQADQETYDRIFKSIRPNLLNG